LHPDLLAVRSAQVDRRGVAGADQTYPLGDECIEIGRLGLKALLSRQYYNSATKAGLLSASASGTFHILRNTRLINWARRSRPSSSTPFWISSSAALRASKMDCGPSAACVGDIR
jgi:hypothetical protein